MNSGTSLLTNTPNFLGMLFNSNINKTQFLTLIGGTDGSNALITTNPEFPISVEYAQADGTQPAISENDSMGNANPTYFGLSQKKNVIQIFQEDVAISRLRERANGRLSGINTAGERPDQDDEEALQILLHLEKMKRDMNYTAINGVYADTGLTNSGSALKTRGIIEAITTNKAEVSGDYTAKDINDMIRNVYDNGAFTQPTLFVNSLNKQKLSRLFKSERLTEVDRNRFVAGISVDVIVTDFGVNVYVVVDNDVPNDTIILVDLPYVKPVFTRDKATGEIITIVEHDQRGGKSKELYAEFGLDHGPEFYHGKLTAKLGNLSVTSVAGTGTGTTKLTVSGVKAGEKLYFNAGSTQIAAPELYSSVDLSKYTEFTNESDVTAANGNKLRVIATNADGEVVATGTATATSK